MSFLAVVTNLLSNLSHGRACVYYVGFTFKQLVGRNVFSEIGGARACDLATVVYSDDDWDYPIVQPSLAIQQKPLIARYRRK